MINLSWNIINDNDARLAIRASYVVHIQRDRTQ